MPQVWSNHRVQNVPARARLQGDMHGQRLVVAQDPSLRTAYEPWACSRKLPRVRVAHLSHLNVTWCDRTVELVDRPEVPSMLPAECQHRRTGFDRGLGKHPDRLLGIRLESELAQNLGDVGCAGSKCGKDALSLMSSRPLQQFFHEAEENIAVARVHLASTAKCGEILEIDLGLIRPPPGLKKAVHTMIAHHERFLIRAGAGRIEHRAEG